MQIASNALKTEIGDSSIAFLDQGVENPDVWFNVFKSVKKANGHVEKIVTKDAIAAAYAKGNEAVGRR